MPKRGLGRGLEALFPEDNFGGNEVRDVALRSIVPGKYQARKKFDQEKLAELAQSIREHGIVQPVLVRKAGEEFELVAGERRWRAAEVAGLATIPAIVRDFSDREMVEISLIENLQREDLNPLEEAEAYQRLTEDFGLTQEQLAERLGRSRTQITNTLRLRHLPDQVKAQIASGALSMGHAKVLLGVEDPLRVTQLAHKVAARGLSVRETERLVAAGSRRVLPRKGHHLDPDLAEVEDRLRQSLGVKVRLVMGRGRGRLELEFYSRQDLQRLVEALLSAVAKEDKDRRAAASAR